MDQEKEGSACKTDLGELSRHELLGKPRHVVLKTKDTCRQTGLRVDLQTVAVAVMQGALCKAGGGGGRVLI